MCHTRRSVARELITATFNWAVRAYATLNRQNITKHAMYILCNIYMHSCNHCCSGKATSGIYCDCLRVALDIQHAVHKQVIAIYELPSSTISFHLSHKRKHLIKTNIYIYTYIHIDFLYKPCLKNFSF